MRKFIFFILATGLVFFVFNLAISDSSDSDRERRAKVNTRVDNNGYWKRMAKEGLAVLNPDVEVPQAVYTGSKISSRMVRFEDSPDVPVTNESSTQSENSIFVDPKNNMVALNSNNSTPANGGSVYGADYLYTMDIGDTWDGSIQGPNGSNSGDPASCIGTDGRWYIGYIGSGSGQDVSYSDDQGASWTGVQVAPKPGGGWGDLADKNHMWIDAKIGSPYENYLYDAWTDFGGSADNQVVVKRSNDNGETWGNKIILSQEVNAGSHNQGVNISTGPNGEVYAVWTIYDGWPQDERAIGFARSLDGGTTWEPSYRIIDNIKGIRNSEVPQNMRVNSFPSMAVDISNGGNSGNIYVVWTNVGVPGTNTGSDRDIYMIKSSDGGDTFGEPIRVNQDPIGQGKAHYLPWITCDASNGIISTIFYDNRNTASAQAEAWVAVSNNAGETWDDFKVSDVAFTPTPIPGLATGYFGDYLAIHASGGKVYPCWTDNRTGKAMTYVSVFETIDIVAPSGLVAITNQETGECSLDWDFSGTTGFDHFNIYRNSLLLITTTQNTYVDQLSDYGYYDYEVTAVYSGNTESNGTYDQTQYGSSTIEVTPSDFTAIVYPDQTDNQIMTIKNTGVLDLDFSLSPFFGKPDLKNYKSAIGGGDEYIHEVIVSNLSVTSACDYYSLNSDIPIVMNTFDTYPIEVRIKNPTMGDQCKVWIDLDQNGIFDENEIDLYEVDQKGVFKGIITIPEGEKQGVTGMRIRLSGPGELTAYGDTEYGEVEDYMLSIASWLSLDPNNGVIPPGDSILVSVVFDAEGMTQGTYIDDIMLITNDLESPVYGVDFTMHVTDMELLASAEPSEICFGENTQLEALVSGGTGDYTYSWVSVPEGFTSLEANPIVEPDENTEYFVSVFDGIVTLEASTSVVVASLPIVDLGGDQILCGESTYDLDAGNPGSNYLWSNDEVSQTITASGSGLKLYWVKVTNGYGCSTTDSIYLNFAEIPVVDLGADTVLCGDATITLDAGHDSIYLWSNGEMTQFITVDTVGYGYGIQNYSVTVISKFGCENNDSISVEFLNCTGINEYDKLNMSVYPNPSNGIFNLSLLSDANKYMSIRIVNTAGKTIYSKDRLSVSGKETQIIDISDYPDGIYSISVSSNGFAETKKIVLKK